MCVAWPGWPLSLSAAVDRIWTGLYKERNERERHGISESSPHKTFSYFVLSVLFLFHFEIRFLKRKAYVYYYILLNKRERDMTWRVLPVHGRSTAGRERCREVCFREREREREERTSSMSIRLFSTTPTIRSKRKGKGGRSAHIQRRRQRKEREKREGPGLASRPTASGPHNPGWKLFFFSFFFPNVFFWSSLSLSLFSFSLYGLAQHVISVCLSLSLDLLSLSSRLASLLQSGRLFLILLASPQSFIYLYQTSTLCCTRQSSTYYFFFLWNIYWMLFRWRLKLVFFSWQENNYYHFPFDPRWMEWCAISVKEEEEKFVWFRHTSVWSCCIHVACSKVDCFLCCAKKKKYYK
jgi:hypothetical protein